MPEEDLSKLSVAELKKRLFWCGASLPPGDCEKKDLVKAVSAALKEKAERDKEQEAKAEKAKQEKAKKEAGVPRLDARPINYEQKFEQKQQEVVDLHVLPEEELRKRIKAAGGSVPDGEVSRFFLVATLKNAQREAALLEQAAAEQAAAEQAAAEEAAPPPPPPPPEPAPQSTPAAPAAAQEPPLRPLGDRDPADLSAGELKRQLRAYGTYGIEKLRGLAEKHEFVTALREAVAERGPPPAGLACPAAPTKPAERPVRLSDAAVVEQMAELAKLAEAAAAEAEKAAAEAEKAEKVVAVVEEEPLIQEVEEPLIQEVSATIAPVDADAVPSAKASSRGRKAAQEPASTGRAGKKRRLDGKELVVSDGEDEVCAVLPAQSVDLLEDDDITVVSAAAQVTKEKVAASAPPKPVSVDVVEEAEMVTPQEVSGQGEEGPGSEVKGTDLEGCTFL